MPHPVQTTAGRCPTCGGPVLYARGRRVTPPADYEPQPPPGGALPLAEVDALPPHPCPPSRPSAAVMRSWVNEQARRLLAAHGG